MKKLLLLSALAMALYGCGGGSGSGTEELSGGPAPANPAPSAVEKGTVKFQVQFPTSEVSKSLIDQETTKIRLEFWGGPSSTSIPPVELTPDTNGVGSATVELATGYYTINATALKTDPNSTYPISLDSVSTHGYITAGSNTVYLTFLRGTWTFVGTDNVEAPIVLSDGKSISKLLLSKNSYYGGYGDSGWNSYDSIWILSDGTTWQNYDEFEMYLGFDGREGQNWNSIEGEYNVTDPTDYDWQAGDRIIMVAPGLLPKDENVQVPQSLTPYLNSKVVDGKTISGTLLELTFVSETIVPVSQPTGMCTSEGYPGPAGARAAALQQSLQGVAKAGTPLGEVTISYTDCEWESPSSTEVEVQVTETWSDVIAHPFKATGSQYVAPTGDTTVIIN